MHGKLRSYSGRAAAAVFSAGVLLFTTGDMEGPMSAHAAQPNAETVAEEVDLEAFARAYPRVESVRRHYLPSIEQAESRSGKRQLMQKAHQAMKEVIEEEGLTVADYSRASVAVSDDPELKQSVVQLLESNR